MKMVYILYQLAMILLAAVAANDLTIAGPLLVPMFILATLRATARHIRYYPSGKMAYLIVRLPLKVFLFFYFLGQNP